MTTLIKRIDFDPEFIPVTLPLVLEHEILEGVDKAGVLIHRAKKEASRIRKQAREVLNQAGVEREEERKKGFEEGRQEGLAVLTEKIVAAESAQEKVLKESEPGIVRMVMEIAEKVIGRELEKGAILDIVKKSIRESVGHKIFVKVHPADFTVLKKREKEILAILEQNESLTIKEDDTIPPGGCVVETEMGTVDARLETQLKGIRKALGL